MVEIDQRKLSMLHPTRQQREALRALATCPEVKEYAYKRYTEEIEELKKQRVEKEKAIDKHFDEIWNSANLYKKEKEKNIVKMVYLGFIDYQIEILEKFRKKFYTIKKGKSSTGWVEKEEIDRANEYPIDNLLDFDRANKRLCLWHDEKTPSLSYKKSQNFVRCFGQCGKSFGAIDVYQKLNNCDFVTAVRELNS